MATGMERHHSVTTFLFDEAEALDEWRLRDWLDMVTDDIVYRVPVRVQREVRDGDRMTGIQSDSFHLDEDRASLDMRVQRLETGFAWAEEPPTRTRHVVGNVRVRDGEGTDTGTGEVAVRSNLLLYHTRWDRPEYTILSGERRDVLRWDGRWRLARRLVVLDNTVIPTLNMSYLL